MFDAVNVAALPPSAAIVAGYVNGQWPTARVLTTLHPHAWVVTIATSADADALILDVERGDASPSDGPAWWRRQIERGARSPGFYVQLSTAVELEQTMKRAGISRPSFRLWTAHWTGKPHICDASCLPALVHPAGATQWTDKYDGQSLDASEVRASFFPQ